MLELNERELRLLVRHSVGDHEEMVEAVVDAFIVAGIDVFSKCTTLTEWINPDVFEQLDWSSERLLYLSTIIWDHRVVLTAEEVRVY